MKDISILRTIFNYDPDSGVITRLVATRKKKAGSSTDCVCKDGYSYISYKNTSFRVHRLGWALHHGYWPEGVIDHIDRNTSNNAVSNLRHTDKSTNAKNAKLSTRSKTGIMGVGWHSQRGAWRVRINKGKKSVHLGLFGDFFEACCARKSAEISCGYSDIHGRAC